MPLSPRPHDFHHQPPLSIEAQLRLDRSLSLFFFFLIFLNRIYTFSILFFLRPMRRAIRESCFYFLFIFIFTDCTWRRDSSWSRTKDRWASLRRCPYIRQSPICTVPVPNTIWNLNIRRICDKKWNRFIVVLKKGGRKKDLVEFWVVDTNFFFFFHRREWDTRCGASGLCLLLFVWNELTF